VTPVEKVITLLEDLKLEVENEGSAEAATYDQFACFCKDLTATKSQAIIDGRDDIEAFSATISEKTAEKGEKEDELSKRKKDHETVSAELSGTHARYEKGIAEYEAQAADLTKAISSLEGAVRALEDSKFVSFVEVRSSVERALSMGVAMGKISEPKKQAVTKMLQAKVDPMDPSYQYRSQGIIDTMNELLKEFRDGKTELDTEWAKAERTYKDTIADLEEKLDRNSVAMEGLEGSIDTLAGEIAQARSDLVNADSLLKDDQLYLKDLTQRCEDRAKDWDQRSHTRAQELEALSGALAVLKGDVSSLDAQVGQRALLVQQRTSPAAAKVADAPKADVLKAAAPLATAAKAATAKVVKISEHKAAPAFLQVLSGSQGSSHVAGLRGAHGAAMSSQARQDKVASLLVHEGQRLGSTALASLAMHVAGDPFAKVKTLIQQLIERLLAESTAEATKKGFCDKEVSKAKEEREFRLADVQKLMVELQSLNLKKDELESEIEVLTGEVAQLRDDLNRTTFDREEERSQNLETMKGAKEGVIAVKQAIAILKSFYKKNSASLLQYSPVDEDTDGAGFSGSYSGKQEQSKGIIGMLEVIASDFDRTSRQTDAAEKKAHEDFVEFDRVSKADISGKETKIALDSEDLKTTENKIEQGLGGLASEQKLLDSALIRLEDLKPTCIDTGMSYADRVQKREEEIAALKHALCILDPACEQQ